MMQIIELVLKMEASYLGLSRRSVAQRKLAVNTWVSYRLLHIVATLNYDY